MGLLLHEQTSNVGPEMMKNLPQNKYFDIWCFLMSLGSESSGYESNTLLRFIVQFRGSFSAL